MKPLTLSLASQFEKAWIFVIVKPGFEGLCKDITDIFSEKQWKLKRTKPKQLTFREAKQLYFVHRKEDFYKDLCEYMSSDISIGMIFEKNCKLNKDMFDEVDKIKDKIRKKWGKSEMKNVLHSSDSLSNMERESQIYF